VSELAVTLTVEQLRELMRDAAEEGARAAMASAPARQDDDPLLTREEAAKLLRICPHSVATFVRTKGLPGTKVVGKWRFRRSELLAWQEGRR